MTRYGHQHKQTRQRLLPAAYGQPCPICGQTMYADQALDLDHTLPISLGGGPAGDRIVHAHCNRSTGATLGNKQRQPSQPASRNW